MHPCIIVLSLWVMHVYMVVTECLVVGAAVVWCCDEANMTEALALLPVVHT
jgi:hypothetical protein